VIADSNREVRERRESTLEQGALRRIATLVGQDAPPHELYAVVAEEVGRVVHAPSVGVARYELDGTATVCGAFPPQQPLFRNGTRMSIDDVTILSLLREHAEPARVDNYDELEGEVAAAVLRSGVRCSVGVPIMVAGRVWGAIVASNTERLPENTGARLAGFTELLAAAIANTEAREALAQLANEQAALRRVATLVAQGASPIDVFWTVSDEVGCLFGTQLAAVGRFEPDGKALELVGAAQTRERWEMADFLASAEVLRTGRSARADAPSWAEAEGETAERIRSLGIVSTVASPIVVEGKLWGSMLLASTAEALPSDTEKRLESFTELVATAIANAESRDALARLADEQAALRRVATLVARDAPPGEVFDAVAMEVGKLLDTDITVVGRYDADGAATAIGSWNALPGGVQVGTRSSVGGHNVLTLVAETERPARVDGYNDAWGEAAEIARRHGWRSSIAAPISVEGRLWGVMLVATQRSDAFPIAAEERLSAFTDLVATAIANAENKSELAASRRRIVAAADEARRRIERDLHDGIQQRLIALTFRARALTRRPAHEQAAIATELAEGLKDVSDELREVSRGIHPTILTEAGLGPALRALARRSDLPIDANVQLHQRLPPPIEAAAYYIASETLTNVAKHAHATTVHLTATHHNNTLTLQIHDNGIGGANTNHGTGILGLTDRAEALGGTITITSPPHHGTTLTLHLPT
jgi:signal transduction histidine kinase